MDFEDYEGELEKIREENSKLLSEFEEWLYNKDLKKGTVNKHLDNIDFYINYFLLYEEVIKPADGIGQVDNFLGYWFIKKALWANKSSIKNNGASLKKFYSFMMEKGEVTSEEYKELVEEIKEYMPEWLATLERFDDPNIEDPEEVWFGGSTEEEERELSHWEELFEAARAFKEARCWEWMYDNDNFGVQDPETGEIAYCCIIGNAEEVFGLVAYLGQEGLQNLLLTISGEVLPDSYEGKFQQKCLMATFEDRNILDEKDREIIKELGLKFRGKKQWPLFRSFIPGYFPWYLSSQECRFLTHILQQALEVSLRCREDKSILETDDSLTFLVRVPGKKGKDLEWEEEYLTAEEPQNTYISFDLTDQLTIKRITEGNFERGNPLEVDIIYLLHPVQEEKDDRPYFPQVCIFLDHVTGLILNFETIQDLEEEGYIFIEALLSMIEENEKIPSKLLVCNDKSYYLFHGICEQLQVPLEKVSYLENIEVIKKELFNRF